MSGPLGVGARDDPATEAVETTMYRALAALRVVVLINAFVINLYLWDAVERPGLAVATLVVMTVWTGVAIWGYDRPALRRLPLMVTDLAVTVATILVTPLVKGPDFGATVPGFWVMGVVLAWGIRGHWVGGLIASLAVSVADIVIRTDLSQANYGNIFLLMIGGPVLGYTSGLLKEMAAARDRAERQAAAAAERARLARVVHDGVLQVLALVQRRGLELGGEAAELGRLAGEQEVALRTLVQGGSGAGSNAQPLDGLHVRVGRPLAGTTRPRQRPRHGLGSWRTGRAACRRRGGDRRRRARLPRQRGVPCRR